MKRRSLLSTLAAWATGAAALPVAAATPLPPIQVYKNVGCGCCSAWADHLRRAGFTVTETEVADTAVMRRRVGLPERFAGCHTAVVAGYVVEGHVPADDVKRLLATKPDAIGLSVPGMPAGSPGMETDGRRDAYQVLLIDGNGRERVFSRHPA